jgi:hypothetical protein
VVCAYEQRQSKRSLVSWPVSVWHPKAARFFNGRSIDVSSDGALLVLPLKAPIRKGQNLELNFPRSEKLAQDKGCFARIKSARVVRVDRSETMESAAIKVGLQFCEQPEMACIV